VERGIFFWDRLLRRLCSFCLILQLHGYKGFIRKAKSDRHFNELEEEGLAKAVKSVSWTDPVEAGLAVKEYGW
jgi:hypothetical protein